MLHRVKNPLQSIRALPAPAGSILGWNSRVWHWGDRSKGHPQEVTSISFSPGGKVLAIALKDGTVRLLRVEGLDELLSRGCDRLKYYLTSHPEALEKLEVCQKRFSSK